MTECPEEIDKWRSGVDWNRRELERRGFLEQRERNSTSLLGRRWRWRRGEGFGVAKRRKLRLRRIREHDISAFN